MSSGPLSQNEDPFFAVFRCAGCRSKCKTPPPLVHHCGFCCLSANHYLLADCSFGQMTRCKGSQGGKELLKQYKKQCLLWIRWLHSFLCHFNWKYGLPIIITFCLTLRTYHGIIIVWKSDCPDFCFWVWVLHFKYYWNCWGVFSDLSDWLSHREEKILWQFQNNHLSFKFNYPVCPVFLMPSVILCGIL